MALEDAHVLAEELRAASDASGIEVVRALERYETRRTPRIQEIHRTGDFLLWWTSMRNQGMVFLRNMGMRLAPPSTLLRDMHRIIEERNDV